MKSINKAGRKMKASIFMMLVYCIYINAQIDLKFVNYGPKASKNEGDDNYIQVINIELPKDYDGSAFLRLYDMSCGSPEDVVIGNWNSRFRFSAYAGELNEDDLLNIPGYRVEINKSILGRFEIGQDNRFYGKWSNFVDLKKKLSSDNIYSLVVEGVDGDDGNNFKVYVSSDSIENKLIPKIKYYSYQPSVALKKNDKELFFKIEPQKEDPEIVIHTFDLDGTKCYFSTLLRAESLLNPDMSDRWTSSKYLLRSVESENDCTFDIGVEYHEDNDITFFITNSSGKKYPIPLEPYDKITSAVPTIEKEIKFSDCSTVDIGLKVTESNEKDSLSYYWQFQEGNTSSQNSIQRKFDRPGKYSGEVIVTDESSKSITRARLEKIDLLINDKPIADAGIDIVAVPKEKIIFDGSKSSDKDGKIVNYSWNFGDGTTATGKKVTHEYLMPGKYSVVLKVEDDYSLTPCNYSIDSVAVVINSQPIPVANDKLIGSVNQLLKFDASASKDNDGTITSYSWNFGKLGIKKGSITEQKYPQPGTYLIELSIKDNSIASNNEAQKVVVVFINDPPKAVAGQDKVAEANEEIILDGSKSSDSDGKIIAYNWTFGDGTAAQGEKVTHRYSSPGKYLISLKVTDDSKTNTDISIDSLYVIVNDKPVAKIVNEVFLNDGNARFDASKSSDAIGGIAKFIWNFGDGSYADGEIVNHIYRTPGTYKVILKVVDNLNTTNNFSVDTSKIVINKRPIADIGPDKVVSVNQKIKLSSSRSIDPDGKIVANRWFVDNQFISNESSIEYTFTQPGNNLIGLEVTDDFKIPAKGIAYCRIKVNSQPIPVIKCITNVAPKQKIKFDASSSKDVDGSVSEFNWTFGDGTNAIGKTLEKSFDKSGSYNVILTVKDDAHVENSLASDTVVVKVNNFPTIKVEESIETCSNVVTFNASKSFDPDGDDLTFHWEFPGQRKEKGGAITTHNFSERGILPVTILADDGLGLSNSISKKTILVKIHQPPVADAGNDTTVCAGDILILSGLKSRVFEQGMLQYEWTFDDSVKLSGSNIFRVFKKGGVYSVLLKITDDSGLPCNSAIDTKIIKVLDAPIAVAGNDIVACASKPITFDGSKSIAPGGVVTGYSWEFGDGESGAGVNPVHVYTKPGNYKVALTITGDIKGKCDNTSKDGLNVTITEAPIASFDSRDSIPGNYDCAFDASSSNTSDGKIISYDWSLGDGTLLSGKVIKHKFAKCGNYNVILNIRTDSKSECNSSSTTHLVTVNAAPVAVISAKKECLINELVCFDASKSFDEDGKIASYKWSFGDGTTQDGINVTHQFNRSGNYKVLLSVTDVTGLENSASKDSIFIAAKSFPIAKFSIPDTILKNEEITLDATGSIFSEGEVTSYEWYLNEKLISSDPVFKIKFDQAGKKRIKLCIAGNSDYINSVDESVKYLDVRDYPTVSIPKQLIVCKNDGVNLIPVVNGGENLITFVWAKKGTAEKTLGKELNPKFLASSRDIYYLQLLDKRNEIIFVDSIIVMVNNPPQLPILNDTTIYIGKANDEILFDGTKAIDKDGDKLKMKWNFGDGKISLEPITFHKYEKEGLYVVELEVNDQKETNCSKVKTTFRITVKR
jgi:large repetitive protein